MKNIYSFISGLLFSIGLIISGMTQPKNVIGFLDFFGSWNPRLAFVMAGAVGVYAVLAWFITKRKSPLCSVSFDIPKNKKVDGRLILGSALFGIGWGISGLCPGPGLVSIGAGASEAFIFGAAMIFGIILFRLIFSKPSTDTPEEDTQCG